ncbi:MAG: sulfatase-like hydrolase/transferase [Mangrovibacterium sp.]
MKIKIFVLLLLPLFACKDADNKENKPNIIFILADDLGYGDLGCFGNTIIKTPNIDKLAADGVTFTNNYAGASVCSPSRCALLTGLHTGHTRIRGNMCSVGGIEGIKETPHGNHVVRRTNLQPQDSTIGNILSNNGYQTCVVNKWHVGGFDLHAGPLDRGFDEFYGWLIHEPKSHNYYPSVRWKNRERYIIKDNLGGKHVDHNTDRSTKEAIEFLKNNKESKFFLYLAYNAPHVPLDAKSWGDYKDTDLSDNDKSYAALITQMDDCIGRILATLKELKLDKNTIIIFASDNGGAKAANTKVIKPNAPLRGWKGELYEGGIRVPLIVKLPNKLNAGKISDFPCYFPDILPTLVDLTKSETTVNTDGVSLLPEILRPNSMSKNDRYLYWEQYSRTGLAQAVRLGDWKLIRNATTIELYNLIEDREETTDLSGQNSDIVRKLSGFMDDAHSESLNWPSK